MKLQVKQETILVTTVVLEPIPSELKIIVEQKLDSLEYILTILEIEKKSSVSINGEQEFGHRWNMLFMVVLI